MAIDITVYSDYICPYCYVSMGALHKLQEKYDLNITWKGMEIHPDTPDEGMLLTDFFKDADVPNMLAGLKTRAEEVGLPFGDLQILSNSHDAHTAAEFARAQGKLEEFHVAMMKAYFGDTKNIGEMEVIMEVAKEVGLDLLKLEEALVTSAYEDDLMQDLADARQWGITGTPTLIINEQYKVVGAQPLASLDQFLEEISD
ncbi:MAG TPA: hypothetical protein DCE41_11705 [Cytophagales bacterium]|nr:hypothetical protein [Cytophagales bacterium]HAA18249.1 hypothetical protein [Cytophagales bacterium]HAP61081.1 hypothetical protein [Cytophagales bacterium]